MKAIWDQRYSTEEYVYGKEPNGFLKEQLEDFASAKILFICEGEGRNAVYAASLGMEVHAFDSSEEGKNKAMNLAKEKGVSINYQVGDALDIQYEPNSFDAVVSIYAHFPPEIRTQIHQKISTWIKPNGFFILEAFNPLQLNYTSGGPKDAAMLYTMEMMEGDFSGLKTKHLAYQKIELKEGKLHDGTAEVIRFLAKK